MNLPARTFRLAALLGSLLLVQGCLSVPKEVVELSYRMGGDLEATHGLHVNLIRAHFKLLRAERNAYVDDVWSPRFIAKFVRNGRLVDIAGGTVVWSPDTRTFIPPLPGQEQEGLLLSVGFWSTAAIQAIQDKRNALLAPLDQQESLLVASVDDAFARLARGNAAITAQLNAMRKVQEVEDTGLSALGLGDLRARINAQLQTVSETARKGLEAIQKADGLLGKVPPRSALPAPVPDPAPSLPSPTPDPSNPPPAPPSPPPSPTP